MKFFLLNNEAQLLVVEARNFRPGGEGDHYDFYEENYEKNSRYVGYFNARSDVDIDPKQALQKGIRRIERNLAAARSEIKSAHERAKNLKATADRAVTLDFSHKPLLPTFQEQEAARKAKEDADRLKKQEEDSKRPEKLKNSALDAEDLYDFFAPIYGMTTTQPQVPPGAAVANSHRNATDVARARQAVPRAYRRSAAEVAREYNVPIEAVTVPASVERELRDSIVGGEYAGVTNWGPPLTPAFANWNDNYWAPWYGQNQARADPPRSAATPHAINNIEALEALLWPTSLPATAQPASPRGITTPTASHANTWSGWSRPTPSATQSMNSENPSTPPARP